jgi:hypothetical protein
MDPLAGNPFAILTFIVAPAVMTNASSVMSLGTSNRFARAIDRARTLSAQLQGREQEQSAEVALRIRQLHTAERRALLLVRALTAFYVSVGSFAAASLLSLVGAILFVAQLAVLRHVALLVAVGAGVVGVCGLVVGTGLLVWEMRLALRILGEEMSFMLRDFPRDQQTTPPL